MSWAQQILKQRWDWLVEAAGPDRIGRPKPSHVLVTHFQMARYGTEHWRTLDRQTWESIVFNALRFTGV